MALEFDPLVHRYTLDGDPVPSVTGVLKAAGLIDFSHIPPAVLDAARTRGTVVHQAIHFFNERDLDVGSFARDFPAYRPYLMAWMQFCAQREFVSVLSEHRIASRRYRVAGTLDCLGLLDGAAVLLDFATGDPGEAAKDLQTAAYLALAREWADEDPALADYFGRYSVIRRYGVALRVDGTFRLEPYTDPHDIRHFLALLEAQRIVAQRRPRALARVVA
jgi:hypothetical protein